MIALIFYGFCDEIIWWPTCYRVYPPSCPIPPAIPWAWWRCVTWTWCPSLKLLEKVLLATPLALAICWAWEAARPWITSGFYYGIYYVLFCWLVLDSFLNYYMLKPIIWLLFYAAFLFARLPFVAFWLRRLELPLRPFVIPAALIRACCLAYCYYWANICYWCCCCAAAMYWL